MQIKNAIDGTVFSTEIKQDSFGNYYGKIMQTQNAKDCVQIGRKARTVSICIASCFKSTKYKAQHAAQKMCKERAAAHVPLRTIKATIPDYITRHVFNHILELLREYKPREFPHVCISVERGAELQMQGTATDAERRRLCELVMRAAAAEGEKIK